MSQAPHRCCRCGSPLARDNADSLCRVCQGTGRAGRPPKLLEPDVSHAARLGAEIRARRLTRGLTLQALASLIGFSLQHISEVERAKAPPSEPFVASCDHVLEADGALMELLPMAVCERAKERSDRSAARRREGRDVPAPKPRSTRCGQL